MKIAIQGLKGAYSELAAQQFFGKQSVAFNYCASFHDLFTAVANKKVRYGVVPIENSLAGSVHENYDHFFKFPVSIVGEHFLHVSHRLLTTRKGNLLGVKRVYSHPQALAQCAEFLRSLSNVEVLPYFDTAGAAAFVAAQKDPTLAAIASSHAAKNYGLKTLASDIQNQNENFTRFAIIELGKATVPSRTSKASAKTKSAKTALICALRDIPGALHKALTVFALREIDLLKIESRPLPGSPFSHLFYLEFSGDMREQHVRKALHHLEEIALTIKILGSFPGSKPKLTP